MTKPLYRPEEAQGVWVYLEHVGKELTPVSRQLLGKARELAQKKGVHLTGVLLGHEISHLVEEAWAYGADVVLWADHPALRRYVTGPYARVVADAVLSYKPDVLLLGATANGRDLAGRLAVRLRTGLTADCVDLAWEEGSGHLVGWNTGFGGGIMAAILCPYHRPQMATVRPGVFPTPQPQPRRGEEVRLPVHLQEADLQVEVEEEALVPPAGIMSAQVLVVGGRGTGGQFDPLWELARLLGGEVGATRVAVDEGWIERERQIGQTGYVVRPKLAIVCGASGAFQFTVGLQDAETIVAINIDKEAPIFEQADYCVVDDLFQVVPALVRIIKEG
ncbi:MAG: electron transfer flavoprotein subunit alpha/FixB family protein [Dehalococcoidia bacterium]|nr:electron transfer flavoprotein subunit alpha/FixB family protein [Dehalococcoidia bacterium]